MAKSCDNCEYWLATDMLPDRKGFCRRYPPNQHSEDSILMRYISYHPITLDADWCGEWKQKE